MKTKEEKSEIINSYRSPLTFYILSVAIPWLMWFIGGYISHMNPYTQLMEWATAIFCLAGLLTPLVVAFCYILPNSVLRDDFLGRIFNLRSIPPQLILVSLFLILVSLLAAQSISLFFGYSESQFQLRGSFSFTSGIFPVWFLLILAPIVEELAWHSYGTDCLRSRFPLFKLCVIFALFWGIWHMPLASINNYYQSNLVESGTVYSINFIVSLFPFVIIMNWIYYKSDRNILLPILFHLSACFFNEIFDTHPMSKVIQTGLLLVFSICLVINEKELFFNRV